MVYLNSELHREWAMRQYNEFATKYLWVIHVVYEITLHTCESLTSCTFNMHYIATVLWVSTYICSWFHVFRTCCQTRWKLWAKAKPIWLCALICILFENVKCAFVSVIARRAKMALDLNWTVCYFCMRTNAKDDKRQ